MSYIEGQFSPIVLVGMSRHSLLNEVDNEQIEEDVLKERDNKINFNSDFVLKSNKKFRFFLYGGSQGSIPVLKCFEKLLAGFTQDELKDIFFIIQ